MPTSNAGHVAKNIPWWKLPFLRNDWIFCYEICCGYTTDIPLLNLKVLLWYNLLAKTGKFKPECVFSVLTNKDTVSQMKTICFSASSWGLWSWSIKFIIHLRLSSNICRLQLNLSLWLSGLIHFLSHSTCWALLADDLRWPGFKSRPGREFSVGRTNGRVCYEINFLDRYRGSACILSKLWQVPPLKLRQYGGIQMRILLLLSLLL